MILVCGNARGHTSAITNLLVDNGIEPYKLENKISEWGYDVFENDSLADFIHKKEKFNSGELILPDENKVIKHPFAVFFLDKIKCEGELKIIYVIRNVNDVIISSAEKSKKYNVEYYYHRYVESHRQIAATQYDVLPVISERVLQYEKDARRMLEFCGLRVDKINMKNIKPLRTRSYAEIRLRRLILKRLI